MVPEVPAESLKRIFEPFATGDPERGHLGLDLTTAADIANRLDGRLEAFSNPSTGTELRLTLPRRDRAAPALATSSASSPVPGAEPGHVRARVLFVGDGAAVGQEISKMLGDTHDVVDAGGSAAVLDLVSRDRDFDVVLFDLCDAGVNAQTLHRALSACEPRLAARMVYIADGNHLARH